MSKNEVVIIANYQDQPSLSFSELCDICRTSPDFIIELIQLEIIHPAGQENNWQFEIEHLDRIKTALRLHHDLEVNMAGIAVILDLIDELEMLRSEHDMLAKHLLK